VRVRQRTAELSGANQQLREEMERRARMELELRQAQKLEAVGRLAAGVAHEINTPVQFVSDSCHFLRDGVGEALTLLRSYDDALEDLAHGRAPAAEVVRRIALARSATDTPYLAENMPLAATRALDGLERIAQIVRSMKEFSHPGSRGRVPADVNRGIVSTLAIARSEYRNVAEVRTDLADLPPVNCFPGELNQVILNLVVNAAHAVGAVVRDSGRRGRIDVRTRLAGEQVEISVADDGCGIPAELRDKIFDPFFTTKGIGEGSGQGLAIARAVVVDKHGGRIDVDSAVGRGTTFTLRIPINPPLARAA
jgi:signal transduction histidine kinase